jgi:acetoacetate decarboxylase
VEASTSRVAGRALSFVAVEVRTEPGLVGYSLPLTRTGRSSLVPPPPWHYSGDFLVIEYRTDPEAARAFLPPELEAGDDLGTAAAIFVDWQSCSESGEELLDPVRAQYKEFFVVLACRYRGEPVTRCPFMWVDKGMPLVRGLVQGFPKKPGSIWITRPVTVGRAGPRLEPGGRFGASLASADRRLAEATLTLTAPSAEGPTVNSPPLWNTRFFPAWDVDGEPLVEHVWAGGRDREISPVWEGEAMLRFFDAPADELAGLAPLEVGKGFWFSFGYTVDFGRRVE